MPSRKRRRTRTTRRAAFIPTLTALLVLLAGSAPAAAQLGHPPPFELPAWETEHPFASIPHPRDVFGFEPGADYRLATNEQIVEYFRRLDAASDRVRVEQIGESVLGRPMILAFISSEANIAALDRWRETAETLAAGRVPEPEARRLAREGKAVVWIDGGLHATEVAGAQHSPLLAYRVAGEETDEMRHIRDNVVLLLMPVMTPDGLDLVAEWTEGSRGTAWEGSSPPVLYQFYTGHDNNRDWFMITQPETRAVTDVIYHQWFPQIVYNQHQTAPYPARIFIPPFSDPMNPNIPPLVVRGVNAVGAAMGERFAEEDKPGAISQITFDMWWNGGMRTAPYFHNMIGILTETAHASVAPQYTSPEEVSSRRLGLLPADVPSVFHPDPWLGGWFRLRDAVEYMVTGAVAVLDVAAELREDWLFNIWRMGHDAIAAGEAGGPFAYVVPEAQANPWEAVNLLNVLRKGGVEVHRATEPFSAGGGSYPAGSYVVPAAQPFRPHLLDLLEPQDYPDLRQHPGGPPDPPYDISGWTLPIQMEVSVHRLDEPFELPDADRVDEARVWPGAVTGSARWGWALPHTANASAIAVNRLLGAGDEVRWGEASFRTSGIGMAPGTILIRRGAGTEGRVRAMADELGLDFFGLDADPGVAGRTLRPFRVGLYKSWQANMDEGWTRWILEQYEFPVDTLHDADIRSADLSRYAAIILPSQGARSIVEGYDPGTRPAALTGGIGEEGLARLVDYAENGGRLVGLASASELLVDAFDLAITDVTEDLSSEEFFVPGTLIRLSTDPSHPIAYGMPERTAAVFRRSAAYAVDDDRLEVVARYGAGGDAMRLSGWSLGQDRLAGMAAVVRAPVGAGDAVLFAFPPQFRAQPRATFKLLFNAIHGATVAGSRTGGAR